MTNRDSGESRAVMHIPKMEMQENVKFLDLHVLGPSGLLLFYSYPSLPSRYFSSLELASLLVRFDHALKTLVIQ
ncbi:hypothetical protein CEXT_700261 [Caerostris extrusa]|uniref:Uncharacterized protein n=1 Tax=Caerostris extrusa TaxID=172846 RepID=A0AAV4UKN3_CAEEX|nr:hypothetical protein CEXT_700261 [Caerostris extrusa]